MLLNIDRRQPEDEFARYKMPALEVKLEGRGNGTKTVVSNLAQVAKALNVDPAYPLKYWGIELGTQTKYDPKLMRATVNGHHSAAVLSGLLQKFVDQYVLCPQCGLPETELHVNPHKERVRLQCRACGGRSDLDMQCKFSCYLLKHPPSA